jgi:hypothetical protein
VRPTHKPGTTTHTAQKQNHSVEFTLKQELDLPSEDELWITTKRSKRGFYGENLESIGGK